MYYKCYRWYNLPDRTRMAENYSSKRGESPVRTQLNKEIFKRLNKSNIMQKIFVTGNLGKNPELRCASNGARYYRFTMASTEGKGEREKTTWFTVFCFVERCFPLIGSLHQGSSVCVIGSLSQKIFTNTQGVMTIDSTIDAHSVDFVSSGSSQQAQKQPIAQQTADTGVVSNYSAPVQTPAGRIPTEDANDLPF